jgi:hypothetical protein
MFGIDRYGNVSLLQNLFPDKLSTYELQVEAYDLGNPTQRSYVLLKFNIKSSKLQLNIPSVTIREDRVPSSTTKVTQISAVDTNTGQSSNMRYELVGGDTNFFRISSTTGEVFQQNVVNAEQQRRYVLTVRVRGPTTSGAGQLVIDVTDVNDEDPVFDSAFYNIQVSEAHHINSDVMQVFATDADVTSPNNDVFYEIQTTDANGVLQLQSNGVIKLIGALDREKKDSYTMVVKAKDRGVDPRARESQQTSTVRITVTDINDHCPVVTSQTKSVSENAAIDDVILQISATDGDSTSQNRVFEYDIDDETDKQTKDFFKIGKNDGVIRLTKKLEYDTKKRFTFGVKVTNTGTSVKCHSSAVIVINVLDATLKLPRFDPVEYEIEVFESLPVGSFMLKLTGVHLKLPGKTTTFQFISNSNDHDRF